MKYIFFHNNKWRLHDGELPVKPENATATIISQMNYANAIADIKEKALEIGNPEIIISAIKGHQLDFKGKFKEGEFYQWPAKYRIENNKAILYGV